MTFEFRTGNCTQTAHSSWYRGKDCNFNPTKTALRDNGGIEEFLLKGWLPQKPFVNREMCVTTFGSCFAKHVSDWLCRQRYRTGERLALLRTGTQLNIRDSHVVRFGEGMVNTFAILQQFEWAVENRRFSEPLWFGANGELAEYDENIRRVTSKLFQETDVFIITLGLSEVWCNKVTGEGFWRAIPADKFNDDIHGFRMSTVTENVENLQRICDLARRANPSATIVFTLSPVPLVATFRPVSCITANSVSKAILRVAVDELLRANSGDAGIYYWPSYEIVKEYASDPYGEDNRHIRPEVIEMIMRKFSDSFLVEPYSSDELRAREAHAREVFTDMEGLTEPVIHALLRQGFFGIEELAALPEPVLAGLVGSTRTATNIRSRALLLSRR